MKTRLYLLASAMLLLAASSIAGAMWPQPGAVPVSRFANLAFQSADSKRLAAYSYRATGFDPLDGPIWFVMHGADRDAERYLQAAAPVAERYRALAIALEFSRRNYPKGEDYTLGVVAHGDANRSAYAEGRWRDAKAYSYMEVERAFEQVRRSLGGRQRGYYLFGHSAGAQFSHRLITFVPRAQVLGAVAANAGWYTLPTGGAEPHFAMPYGLQGTPLEQADLRPLLAAPLTVLLGTHDTTISATDPLVRGSPGAMWQGATRLARGQRYFETGKSSAQALGAPFDWRLAMAPGAGHEMTEVIASAGFLLFDPDETACPTTPAAEAGGLVINEVLADPPRGRAGDANHDGVRGASADEFVEIVNTGASPVCLTGWTLSDSTGQRRHLFPIGRALAPGKAVVVFGGGIPAGDFGGSNVQSATSSGGLSLARDADTLMLRDANGAVAQRFSWGECAPRDGPDACWRSDLGFAASVVRWPEGVGSWRRHRDVTKFIFSPGLRADGSAW